jgi:hypothetical protein
MQAAAGTVRYFQWAGSNWDSFTSSTDPHMQSMIRNDVSRMGTYTPFFNPKRSGMPRTQVYFDSYNIYSNFALATQHPEWILEDSMGRKRYIPRGCSGETCPRYAGRELGLLPREPDVFPVVLFPDPERRRLFWHQRPAFRKLARDSQHH